MYRYLIQKLLTNNVLGFIYIGATRQQQQQQTEFSIYDN